MKTNYIFGIILVFIALILALAITHFNQPFASALNAGSAPIIQVTATPLTEGISEIGSTNGILIMGVVIVLIVILPVLLYKKK